VLLFSGTLGEVCVYNEKFQVGVLFDLLGNPTETTVGCKCPPTKKLKCDANQEAEFEKLQLYVPKSESGVTECCVSGSSKSQIEKDVKKFKPKSKHGESIYEFFKINIPLIMP